jgi:hypothetical protein
MQSGGSDGDGTDTRCRDAVQPYARSFAVTTVTPLANAPSAARNSFLVIGIYLIALRN